MSVFEFSDLFWTVKTACAKSMLFVVIEYCWNTVVTSSAFTGKPIFLCPFVVSSGRHLQIERFQTLHRSLPLIRLLLFFFILFSHTFNYATFIFFCFFFRLYASYQCFLSLLHSSRSNDDGNASTKVFLFFIYFYFCLWAAHNQSS